ncbi:MAG: helix-turn-helix domain-containing protein [Alphaproteobacteria bacterium]
MEAWHFTTEAFDEDARGDAWRDALGRVCLPPATVPGGGALQGHLKCIVSPMGIEFALVESEAQEISGRYPDQEDAIWLALMLDGEAVLHDDNSRFDVMPGDVIYGPAREDATLTCLTAFQMLFVRVPRVALSPRLIAPLSLKMGHFSGRRGIRRVFANLLQSMAVVLDDITAEELRAVELALTEMLIASLADQKTVFGLGGAAGARTAHLHRICQTIETMLSDPDLTPAKVAESHGVSLRYMQKLFTATGNTFSNYVRTRRLERCRADLVSPLHAQLSISEICFRWGFNGSAHFSRTFRNQYGMSPRDYRRTGGRTET